MYSLHKALSTVGCIFLLLSSGASAASKPKKKVVPKGVVQKVGALANKNDLKAKTVNKIEAQKRLNRREKKEVAKAELETYKQKRRDGFDEISNTEEAVMLRNYRLRNKKKKGLFRKKQATLSQVLFPGVSPEEYEEDEPIWIYADLVNSKKTPIPYEFYELPGCAYQVENSAKERKREKKNLGSRLQGHDLKPAPFNLLTLKNKSCTPMCKVKLEAKKLQWLKQLIKRQYRVQLQLDQLPVLMRSAELNYAVRGYPVGFRTANKALSKPKPGDKKAKKIFDDQMNVFLYNHLKFTITYHKDADLFDGIRITGFDVHPVSISHKFDPSKSVEDQTITTCQGMDVENNQDTYLSLSMGQGSSVDVMYSYDVTWEESKALLWADRWDV